MDHMWVEDTHVGRLNLCELMDTYVARRIHMWLDGYTCGEIFIHVGRWIK